MLKYFQYKIINHRQISTLTFPALIISDHIIQTVRKEAITLNIEDSCISCIDTDWSYQLAKRMEKEKTNPVLGYRTAGSNAETATGDMLYKEMKAIGLTDVTKDTFTLDGWEFEKAVLKFTDEDGQEYSFQMGGY